MRVSIRPEEPLMKTSGLQHADTATRNCPVCVSGLLTLDERDGPLDLIRVLHVERVCHYDIERR